MTVSSFGRCAAPGGSSIWEFAGPIAVVHFALMAITNWLLYKISDLGNRYQEQKYVILASMFVFELLIIGLPVLFSVGDNTSAVFVVLTGVIALNDIGVLCFLFVPKMFYVRKGLESGVGVGESIRKSSHKKAKQRENSRRSNGDSKVSNKSIDSAIPSGVNGSEQFPNSIDNGASLEERCRLLEEENVALRQELKSVRGQMCDVEKGSTRKS